MDPQDPPKNRYEKLENRIGEFNVIDARYRYIHSLHVPYADELEALLRERGSIKPLRSKLPPSHATDTSSSSFDGLASSPAVVNGSAPSGLSSHTHSSMLGTNPFQEDITNFSARVDISRYINNLGSSGNNVFEQQNVSASRVAGSDSQTSDLSYQLSWPGWPVDLPAPTLLRHL